MAAARKPVAKKKATSNDSTSRRRDRSDRERYPPVRPPRPPRRPATIIEHHVMIGLDPELMAWIRKQSNTDQQIEKLKRGRKGLESAIAAHEQNTGEEEGRAGE